MIGFRVDANEDIATGHMRRCITLAEQLKELGEDCIFLLSDTVSLQHIKKYTLCDHSAGVCHTGMPGGYKFSYIVLNVKWNDWDAGMNAVEDSIRKFGISCLFVDSYQATEYFLSKINQIVPVMYLDDICEKAYDVTALVCTTQSRRAERIPFLYQNTDVKILAGSKYLILRKEFYPAIDKNPAQGRKKIMITTGGTDPFHITLKLIKAYLQVPFLAEYDFIAVLGAMNRDGAQITSLIKKAGKNHIEILQDIDHMGDVMRSCHAAVSAGGGTVYELCVCQIPTVCIAFSDDQAGFGEDMEKRGILQFAGDIRKNSAVTIKKTIEKLKVVLTDSACRAECIQQMQQFADGSGARRIAKEILKLKRE